MPGRAGLQPRSAARPDRRRGPSAHGRPACRHARDNGGKQIDDAERHAEPQHLELDGHVSGHCFLPRVSGEASSRQCVRQTAGAPAFASAPASWSQFFGETRPPDYFTAVIDLIASGGRPDFSEIALSCASIASRIAASLS